MTYSNATWEDVVVPVTHTSTKAALNHHGGVTRNTSSFQSTFSVGGGGGGDDDAGKFGSTSAGEALLTRSATSATLRRKSPREAQQTSLSNCELRRAGRTDSFLSEAASGGGIRRNFSGGALASAGIAGLGLRRNSRDASLGNFSGGDSSNGNSNNNNHKPKRRGSLTSLVRRTSSAVSLVSLAASAVSSSDASGDNKPVKNVAYYIEARKWRKVLKRLDAPEGREEVRASSTSARDSDDFRASGANALHRACANAAPFEIVRSICAVCPDLAVEADSKGRTALHLAAAASPEMTVDVVEYLHSFNGGAAYARDDGGRLPLHAACRLLDDHPTMDSSSNKAELNGSAHSQRRRFSGGYISKPSAEEGSAHARRRFSGGHVSKPPRRKISLSVVRALCEAAPFAIHDEDTEEGLTPVEHALRSSSCCGGGSNNNTSPALEYLLKESRLRWQLRINKEGASAELERERWTSRRTEAMKVAADASEQAEEREARERESMDDVMGDLLGVTLGGASSPRAAAGRPVQKRKGKKGMPHELMCELNKSNSSISVLGMFEETSEIDDLAGRLVIDLKGGEE